MENQDQWNAPLKGNLNSLIFQFYELSNQLTAMYVKIYLFPPPALPGSGKMGMISARCFKAPLDNVDAKIQNFTTIK